jgi:hypothetical protein
MPVLANVNRTSPWPLEIVGLKWDQRVAHLRLEAAVDLAKRDFPMRFLVSTLACKVQAGLC